MARASSSTSASNGPSNQSNSPMSSRNSTSSSPRLYQSGTPPSFRRRRVERGVPLLNLVAARFAECAGLWANRRSSTRPLSARGATALDRKPGDVLTTEPEIVGRQDPGFHPSERGNDVEKPRELPCSERDVQIGRRCGEQEIERSDQGCLGQPFRFVEGQHERPAMHLDRMQEESCPRVRPSGIRFPGAECFEDVEPGVLEGVGEIGVKLVRLVFTVQCEPSDGRAGLESVVAALGEHGGLAESPGSDEQRQPPRGGSAVLGEFFTTEKARRPRGSAIR